MIEGCLIPDYKKRLQNADEVMALIPKGGNEVYKPIISNSIKKQVSTHRNGILLRVMQGDEYNKVYKLNDLLNSNSRILTMGRESDDTYNAIPIRDTDNSYMSRCHCTLEYDAERNLWFIRDGQWRVECPIGLRFKGMFPCRVCTARCPNMNSGKHHWKLSMNGTYVNSSEVDKTGMPLKLGDIITIGDVKLRVEEY